MVRTSADHEKNFCCGWVEERLTLSDAVCIGPTAPFAALPLSRGFSTTSPALDWLTPKFAEKSKSPKGRPHVPTGGSSRGTTVVWGEYGLRMKDHDRRVPASHLKIAEETIKRRLRGMDYNLYKRVSANIGVYTKGNEQRMGKGKGKFDYWTAKVAVSRVVFELSGKIHEKVAREAFRLAGHKLPGMFFSSFLANYDTDTCVFLLKVSGNLSRKVTLQWLV